MSVSEYDTSPTSSTLETVIDVYYCLSLPYFLAFLAHFSRQYYSKFYLNANASQVTGGKVARTANIAQKVAIIKILIAAFASSTWINEMIFVFLATPNSCFVGWKISCFLYVFAKFWVYAFLLQRGELVAIGPKTLLEKLIQFGTLGVPLIGILGSIVGNGVYVERICAIEMPYWLTVLIIVLDTGLSCGYLLMFVLRLRNLEQNLMIYRLTASRKSKSAISVTDNDVVRSKLKQDSIMHQRAHSGVFLDDTLQRRSNLQMEKLDSPEELRADNSDQKEGSDLHTESASLGRNVLAVPLEATVGDLDDQSRIAVQVQMSEAHVVDSSVHQGDDITATALHDTQSAPSTGVVQKDHKLKSENVSVYHRVMQIHTKITAITCMSTIICMLLFVLYNALYSRTLQIISGPFAGTDLFINVTAIAYMTRGTQNDH